MPSILKRWFYNEKRIFSLLSIALIIALLASSFVMLGATPVAADTVTIDEIVIGDNTYTVTDESTVYDAYNALVAGKEPVAYDSYAEDGSENDKFDFTSGVIDYTNSDWSFTGDIRGTAFTQAVYMTGKTSGINQIAFSPETIWVKHSSYDASAFIANDTLVFYPGHSWSDGSGSISANYTVSKEGKVVLYDPSNNISLYYQKNPVWSWWDGQTSTATIYIYKNETLLWSNESNPLKYGNISVAFPDLGEIEVAEGDVISVKYVTNGNFTPVECDLAVAYITEPAAIEVEEVTVHGQKLVAEKDGVYRAYDSFMELINNNFADNTAIDFTGSVWNVEGSMSTWGNETPEYDEHSGYKKFSICSYVNDSQHFEVCFANERMYVNPGNDQGVNGRLALNFIAPKTGTVSLLNITGDIYGEETSDYLPNGSWWYGANYTLTVTIKKNGVEIWPNGAEANNTIYWPDSDWTLKYPVLNDISVSKGDKLTIEYTVDAQAMAHVKSDPVVVYTHEHDWDEPNVVEEATYIFEGKQTVACKTCTTVKEEAIARDRANPISYDEVKYDPATNKLTLKISYGEALLKDYAASIDWAPGLWFFYNMGGKDYSLPFFFMTDDGCVIEIDGFNASRLTESFSCFFRLGWNGNPEAVDQPWPEYGSWGSPAGFDTDTAYTVDPMDIIDTESGKAAALDTLLEAIGNETEAVVAGEAENNNHFNAGTSKVDIKNATAEIKFAFNNIWINKILENGTSGRTVSLIVNIGDDEHKISLDKLMSSITVKISGLSFKQMYGDISAQLIITYADNAEKDITTDIVKFNFVNTICESENTAAQALEAYAK